VKCINNFKAFKVWQKPKSLWLTISRISATIPKEERYGITSQIRRSVVSIPSDTGEGYERNPNADISIRNQTLESLTP